MKAKANVVNVVVRKDKVVHAKAEVLKSGPKGQTRTKVEVVVLIGDNQEV